jgi:F-type H+-transporting ATPase subunit b
MMKLRILLTLVVGTLAWQNAAARLLASDEEHGATSTHTGAPGHGDEHASPSLFAGDLGNAFWTVLIFVVLLVVLGKFAWPAILDALKKREEFIRESLESAKRDREAAESRLKQYEAKILEARAEASAIVEEGRRDAEALKRKLDEAAKSERDAELERAKREIHLAKETAIKELYDRSADMAVQIASRLIRKEIDTKQHHQLIADAISSVNSGSRN